MYKLTYPVSGYEEDKIDKDTVLSLIKAHRSKIAPKIRKNLRYYNGDHNILTRKKTDKDAPNSKIVCNHAKDITDTVTGYFMGYPITYRCDDNENLDKLTTAFDIADVDEVDGDNALDMSRAGLAFEYIYAKKDSTVLTIKTLSPLTTFIVYDDTIEENELFAVYYDRFKDDSTNKFAYKAYILTEHYRYEMYLYGDMGRDNVTNPIPHNLGGIPVVLYQNNTDCIGDFEQQTSLMDAYNTIMSDRVDDKEQFLNALLILYGARLADDVVDENDTSEVSKALRVLRDNGFLELPTDAKAEYITRTFDETGMELLRKAIKEDIYNLSHVPNMTDEKFSGNSSGVAMEYKLLALENITATKQKYYTKGLKKRIKLFCNYLNLMSISANPSSVIPTFKRSLPKNIMELSQIINNLKGMVSKNTLIQQLPFVEDPEGESKKVDEENQEALKRQQEMFGFNKNTPLENEDEKSVTSSSETDE